MGNKLYPTVTASLFFPPDSLLQFAIVAVSVRGPIAPHFGPGKQKVPGYRQTSSISGTDLVYTPALSTVYRVARWQVLGSPPHPAESARIRQTTVSRFSLKRKGSEQRRLFLTPCSDFKIRRLKWEGSL